MKKLRLKKKNALIALGIFIFIIIEIINPSKIIAVNRLTSYGYSKDASKRIIKLGLKSKVLELPYSKFIDLNIASSNFDEDNMDYYLKINYDEELDLNIVNDLIKKGYSSDEVNLIVNHGSVSDIKNLLTLEKVNNISDYLKYDYAKVSLLNRYEDYKNKNGTSMEDAVTYVNIGLDKEFYSDYNMVTDFSITMLVNKYNKLDEKFVPSSLVAFPNEYCSSVCHQDNEEVVKAFVEMAKALKEEKNLNIYVTSAYRTYGDQEDIYNELTKLYGENYDVARAGFSEHQTGLSLDIGSGSSASFKGSKEEAWLRENAYKYGFIFRYESEKSKITGYNEPWHFRYVGKDIAEDLMNKKLTFDEYYVRFLERGK